jgi:chemotaxis protein MotB
MTNPVQPVIVVKKKGGHAAHHGGAWKVAYADFVTAMMAFFLVMWLVNQSKPVKAAIGGYFRDPAAFDASGGRGVLPGGSYREPASRRRRRPNRKSGKRMEAAVLHIREVGKGRVRVTRDQSRFTNHARDLDRSDRTKTIRCSSTRAAASLHGRPNTSRRDRHELGSLDHQLDLEGHTDSRAVPATDKYSNWNCRPTSERARRVMERGGLRGAQVTSVRGLADRQLRFPPDPFDARNRRVSILVKNPLLKAMPAAGSQRNRELPRADHAGAVGPR